MKKALLSLLALACITTAQAVDYTFDHEGAVYDYTCYQPTGHEIMLKAIEEDGVDANGVFTVPATVTLDDETLTLTEIQLWSLPGNLKAFSVDSRNAYFTVVDGVLYSKDMTKVLAVPPTKTNYKIPSSVTTIGFGAFTHNTLTSIDIPENVTVVKPYAFNNCVNLSRVNVPSTLTSVDECSFEGTPFYSHLPQGMTYLGRVAFKYVGEHPASPLVIKEGTTEIAGAAFREQKNLTTVQLPLSVKHIGPCAFNECDNLKRVSTIASDCKIDVEAFPSTKMDIEYVFENGTSRYFQKGDNVVAAAGFYRLDGVDTPPMFSAAVEANTHIDSEYFKANERLDYLTLNEGGTTLSELGYSDTPETFSPYFGHPKNKRYNLRTNYYKKGKLEAKDVFGIFYVRMHIDQYGKVSKVKVVRHTEYQADPEAVERMLMHLPPFKPAMKNGKPVPVWVDFYVGTEPLAGGQLYSMPL